MESTFDRITCPSPFVAEPLSTPSFLVVVSLFIIPRWAYSVRAVRRLCTHTNNSRINRLTQDERGTSAVIIIHFFCSIVLSLTFFEFVVLVGQIPSHAWVVCVWFLHHISFGLLTSLQSKLLRILSGTIDTLILGSLILSPLVECGPPMTDALIVGCGSLLELLVILVFGIFAG
jgi:hypothetical protein